MQFVIDNFVEACAPGQQRPSADQPLAGMRLIDTGGPSAAVRGVKALPETSLFEAPARAGDDASPTPMRLWRTWPSPKGVSHRWANLGVRIDSYAAADTKVQRSLFSGAAGDQSILTQESRLGAGMMARTSAAGPAGFRHFWRQPASAPQ